MTERESLKDYDWDTRYSSATHNLIKEFFVPALSRSRFYFRIAAYFSSTSIAAAFRGISAFIENGEKMYLIVGCDLSQADVDAINNGISRVDDFLHKQWQEIIKDFENNVIKKRFELLSWLIANNLLEIKIGINKNSSGRLLSSDESTTTTSCLFSSICGRSASKQSPKINERFRVIIKTEILMSVAEVTLKSQQEKNVYLEFQIHEKI